MLIRMRRNRKSAAIRALIQEHRVSPTDFIAPLFLLEGAQKKEAIASLPHVFRLSLDLLLKEVERLMSQGILSVLLFPILLSDKKNPEGKEAYNEKSFFYKAIRTLKKTFPELCLMADVALDPYTSHGHDGIVSSDGKILNDLTIESLVKMALLQAEAGVDFVAPSDMMDGRVAAIRRGLDSQGHVDVGILAYSAKYASTLYGPFREALQVRLAFGDKKTYQMASSNVREALLEARLDEEEGADLLMIKPALYYLDVIAKIKERSQRPIAAYHVSGEYAMVMAAHERGWLDGPAVFQEAFLSLKRAGADLIVSYAVHHPAFPKLLET